MVYLKKQNLNFNIIKIVFGISDYIFFANHYRKVQVVNPVFVVSTARSGSTAFHETLSKDKQFITPSMWEVTFPYVSAFYFFKFLGYLDGKIFILFYFYE